MRLFLRPSFHPISSKWKAIFHFSCSCTSFAIFAHGGTTYVSNSSRTLSKGSAKGVNGRFVPSTVRNENARHAWIPLSMPIILTENFDEWITLLLRAIAYRLSVFV